MNDETFTYDFGALARARDDVAAAVRDFGQTHDDVDALLRRLGKTWTAGKAAEAMQAWRSEWNTITADLADELDELRAALDRSYENASGAEATNRDMWTP